MKRQLATQRYSDQAVHIDCGPDQFFFSLHELWVCVDDSHYGQQCCIKMLSKSISITNYKIHFFKVFQLLLSITFDKWSKIQNTFNESNWNTKYILESLRVSQSMNIRLINKRNINIFLGLVLLPWLWQFNVW